jgi:hypothetical protein
LTVPKLARRAGVDPSTVRALVKGRRWPSPRTFFAINRALEWPDGELGRRTMMPEDLDAILDSAPVEMLIGALCRRLQGRHSPDGDRPVTGTSSRN